MKQFFFFFFTIAFLIGNAQNTEKNTDIIYSEVGLYTMDTFLDEATIKKELQTVFPNADFVNAPQDSITKTTIFLQATSNVAKDYPVYGMEYLSYFAEGFTQQQKENLVASKHAFIIAILYKSDEVYRINNRFYNWIYKKIKDTNYVAYDGETRTYFLPETWKARRMNAWENERPDASTQIIIHTYRKDKFCRSITLGMQRYNLPDIVIDDSTCSQSTEANMLIQVIAQLLFEGNEIENGNFEVNFNAISNSNLRESIKKVALEDAPQKATIRFKEGIWEEGDPMNFLIQVNFENDAYENPQAYENAIYAQLFGVEDGITSVTHNQEILDASERAKKRLPSLKKLFNNGLSTGSTLLLKAPFTTDDGGSEWMWIEVISWKTEAIEGILQNEPYYIKNLKSGAKVTVQQTDVFDYILYKADGTSEGNETGRLIQKYGN